MTNYSNLSKPLTNYIDMSKKQSYPQGKIKSFGGNTKEASFDEQSSTPIIA